MISECPDPFPGDRVVPDWFEVTRAWCCAGRIHMLGNATLGGVVHEGVLGFWSDVKGYEGMFGWTGYYGIIGEKD
jgi:hypothetical protein